MKLSIIRHGDAGDSIEDDPQADMLRPLTELGSQQVAAMAKKLIEEDRVPTVIFSSPATRAMQTAKQLRKAFVDAGYAVPQVRAEDGLGPSAHRGHALQSVVQKIASDESLKRVMVVSHHDSINKGLAALNGAQPLDIPIFAKAEARGYKVDRDSGEWKEDWQILPSQAGVDDQYGMEPHV